MSTAGEGLGKTGTPGGEQAESLVISDQILQSRRHLGKVDF